MKLLKLSLLRPGLLRLSFFRGILLLLAVVLSGCDSVDDMVEVKSDLTALAKQWNTTELQWNDAELLRLERGQKFYKRTCAACHMASGEGQISVGAPALKDNAFVQQDPDALILLVLEGSGSMPGFSHSVTSMELADILTYTANAWGNNSGMVIEFDQIDQIQR